MALNPIEAYKILMIVPAASLTATRNFVDAQIDPGKSAGWFTLQLSASGSTPATHYAACFHSTIAEGAKWINRICTALSNAGVPTAIPADRATETFAQKRTWLSALRTQTLTTLGIYMTVVFNDQGEAPDPTAALTATGLKLIQTSPG